MGELQEKQGVISLPASCPSQSIVDVSENMRAKIYSIFCKIGELIQFDRKLKMCEAWCAHVLTNMHSIFVLNVCRKDSFFLFH